MDFTYTGCLLWHIFTFDYNCLMRWSHFRGNFLFSPVSPNLIQGSNMLMNDSEQGVKIYNAVYSMDWHLLPLKIQKRIVLLMIKNQKPMNLTGLKIVNSNRRAYMEVNDNNFKENILHPWSTIIMKFWFYSRLLIKPFLWYYHFVQSHMNNWFLFGYLSK